MGKDPVKEIAEGVLRYDIDEGWVLDGPRPRGGTRVCDLFPELEGKRVRVTVEVLRENPVEKE